MTSTLTPPAAKTEATPRPRSRPEAPTPPPTTVRSTATQPSSAGAQPGSDQAGHDDHVALVAAAQLDRGQHASDAHTDRAPVDQPPPPADPSAGTTAWDDPVLLMAADLVDNLERIRIATTNRLGALRRAGLEGFPQEQEVAGLAEGLGQLEKQAVKTLERAMRRHPLGPWVKRTTGLGEKTIARLLATIGDPYLRGEMVDRETGEVIEPARPRCVAELRSYCGVGDASRQVRRKGQKANWNDVARKRLWLVAQSCIKAKVTSPYGAVYDDARERYSDALHNEPCVRCAPSGHPAPVGSPLSAGHQHARATRAVMKAVLRDLWREAKALHEGEG